MNQFPIQVWNQIAMMEDLKTEWAKKMFNASSRKQLDQMMEAESKRLSKENYSTKAILAFQTIAPLLMEKDAIKDYLYNSEEASLIPEVETVEDVLFLADREYWMEEEDCKQLIELITRSSSKSTISSSRKADLENELCERWYKFGETKNPNPKNTSTEYRNSNRIFTKEMADKARESLRRKLNE